jgi:hypothetical protein
MPILDFDMPTHEKGSIINHRATIVRPMAVAAVLLALLSLPMKVSAQDGHVSWKLDIGFSSVYDNNILRYSDKYITRFDNSEDPGRFHINTRDDLILVSSIRASATMNLIGSLNTTGGFDIRKRTYTHNPIKDWSSISFSLRQDLSKKLAAQIAYNYIPGFYVRHYRDDDWVKQYGFTPVTFQSYDFKKDELAGWVQYALLAGTRVRTWFSYGRYYYNENFTEYDSRNTLIGFAVYQTLYKNIKVNGGFEAVHSRGEGNAEMDPSFNENTYLLGVDFQLPKVFGRSNNVGVDGEYARRCFTSAHYLQVDREHAGRQDFEYRLSITYGFSLLENLDLVLNYAWHKRDTETLAEQNATYLSDEKDYRQYQIGLEARYTFDFVPDVSSELERRK